MELQGDRLIPAALEPTWNALNDTDILKACIPGCESLVHNADGTFDAVIALRVGPVNARFKGRLTLSDVRAPHAYTLHFDGQGGVAGFGKGSADVTLEPEGAQTRLAYRARAQVGGKMAQIGSRLIDAAAGKITADFFSAFEAKLQAEAPPPADAAATIGSPPPLARAGARIDARWWLVGAAAVLAVVYAWLS